MESPSSLKKKATGLSRGLHISEQRPRAALTACPGLLFSSLRVLTEEGRPIDKAKKAKMKETNLLSSSDHGSPYHLFSKKSQ
jgi:hypothetical protein